MRCCPASGCPLLSQWGIQFLLCLVAGSAAYVGGGAAYGKRHGSSSGGRLIEAHPHFARWKDVEALAMDGLAYSRARMGGGGGRGAGYRRVSSAEVRKEGGAQPERKKEKQRKDKTDRIVEDKDYTNDKGIKDARPWCTPSLAVNTATISGV